MHLIYTIGNPTADQRTSRSFQPGYEQAVRAKAYPGYAQPCHGPTCSDEWNHHAVDAAACSHAKCRGPELAAATQRCLPEDDESGFRLHAIIRRGGG